MGRGGVRGLGSVVAVWDLLADGLGYGAGVVDFLHADGVAVGYAAGYEDAAAAG